MQNDPLQRGDLVEVESPAAILATLDEGGALEGLPFMPEMAAFCGRRLVVDKRAERVCDTARYTGSRRLPGTVLLADLRCDGSFHGGCQAECRLFWKERWLRRIEAGSPAPARFSERDVEALVERTRRHVERVLEPEASVQHWRCQATELTAASEHLRLCDPRSYVREYVTGNVGLGRLLRVGARASLEEPMRKMGLMREVHLAGTGGGAEVEPPLDLQPGELVQVKTRQEIAATLTAEGRHRGLWFDREMLRFCGGTFRVRQRIHRFIDERAGGRMIRLNRNRCVTLEGVVCSGELSLRRWFCPRAIYPYWHEAWLRRVDVPS